MMEAKSEESYETDGSMTEGGEDHGPAKPEHVFSKRLPAEAFSHYESRDEVRTLDYTPTINRRPVDLATPLRARRMGRKIKVIMCITMYNEDAEELKRSLRGVSENLDQMEAGGLMWHEFLVTIIVDGREKLNKTVKDYMEKELNLWDDDMLKFEHRNNEVTCHIFEKTVDLPKHSSQREYFKPLQIVFAVKEKNGGKLNSHLWFFSAFTKQIQPDYCFLLDVGTTPQPGALFKLYEAMQINPQLGGVCGEIAVHKPRVYNLVEASQHFEYKVSHVLDKAMESVFGYVSVLPGAFSAYRWKAIRGEPLNQYFYVEEHSVKAMGPFLANMYLAEDRVLCFELLAKRHRTWTLHFVSGAIAETDVPDNLLELIKQRRRWLNGSFFSLVYYINNFSRLLRRSDHSWFRRLALAVQFFYQFSLMILSWFGVGSLYLSLVIIFTLAFEQIGEAGVQIMWGFSIVYVFLTLLQLLLGLGSKPSDVQKIYFVSSMGYGLIMIFALGLSIWHLSSGVFSTLVLFASTGAFVCYFLAAMIHGSLLSVMVVLPQYLYMLPTYVNIFTIFSFCNMHDISWGTKEGNLENQKIHIVKPGQGGAGAGGVEKTEAQKIAELAEQEAGDADERTAMQLLAEAAARAEEEARRQEIERRKAAIAKEHSEMAKEFSMFRTRLLGLWMGSNWVYVTAVLHYDLLLEYSMAIAVLIFWTLFFRMCGSVVYQMERIVKALWSRCCFWCCFRCCWERHYGGAIHHAARVHADKMDDDQTDSDVSEYDQDEDDRWGAVDFGDEYDEMMSDEETDDDYTDEDDMEYAQSHHGSMAHMHPHPSQAHMMVAQQQMQMQQAQAQQGRLATPMMDLSHHVAQADHTSSAILRKCDDLESRGVSSHGSRVELLPHKANHARGATPAGAGYGNLSAAVAHSEQVADRVAAQ